MTVLRPDIGDLYINGLLIYSTVSSVILIMILQIPKKLRARFSGFWLKYTLFINSLLFLFGTVYNARNIFAVLDWVSATTGWF